MPSVEIIRDAVTKYLSLLEERKAEELTHLFADDAFIEDPAGSAAKSGRAEISAHFQLAANYEFRTELLALRIAGTSAAIYFRVVTVTPEGSHVLMPIDVLTFNEAGLVTSMRAYWGPNDFTTPAHTERAVG